MILSQGRLHLCRLTARRYPDEVISILSAFSRRARSAARFLHSSALFGRGDLIATPADWRATRRIFVDISPLIRSVSSFFLDMVVPGRGFVSRRLFLALVIPNLPGLTVPLKKIGALSFGPDQAICREESFPFSRARRRCHISLVFSHSLRPL